MKKIISKREYDTETSTLIEKRTSGVFGDPAGYEETLYQTEKGYYFLYVNGGAESKYQFYPCARKHPACTCGSA